MTPHLEPRTPVIQQLLGKFGESEKVATAMFPMAVRVLTKDNRFKHLNQEQVNTCAEEMLRDLLRAYKGDTMESWILSLEVLFRA